jgi:hypothetical protein
MADRHRRKRVNLKVERVTARDPTLLVVFLPGVGVDPIVEVLLQTAVEGGLIKEEVHPSGTERAGVARGLPDAGQLHGKVRHETRGVEREPICIPSFDREPLLPPWIHRASGHS